MKNLPFTVEISSINDRINETSEKYSSFEENASPSYFQTWSWLGSWWEYSGKYFNPQLLAVKRNQTTVALSIFTTSQIRRHYLVNSKQCHLNESGSKEYDFIIEHNGILTTEPNEREICVATIKGILSNNLEIDEIVFSGINHQRYNAYLQAGNELGLQPKTTRTDFFSFVNLDELRNKKIDFISTLSKNTRPRIRRSIKAFEAELGKINIQEASSVDQSLQYLTRLKALHQDHWVSKGMPGSFKNKNWESFIVNMINTEFENGRIQLLKITAGDTEIGYILNLVYDGYVNMLQSGFKYFPDNKMKPGYVSHYLAIQHNIDKGNHTYDFLAGKSQYKESLASKKESLYWLTLQRRKPIFYLEDLAIRTARTLRGFRNHKTRDI